MATSGSTNYSVTRDDIVTEALQLCGVVEEGGSATANQLTDCSRTLNMLIKHDMTDALQLWLDTTLVIFPVKGQKTLTAATSGGDRMCLESQLVTTKLNGDHASGATTLTVDDTTSMTASDIIGIVTDDSDIHWTTISSVASSTSLVIASGLDSTASDNDRVYTYTTAFTQKVARLNEAWIRSTDDLDIPINLISKRDYSLLSNKLEAGRINQIWFDPQRATSIFNVWMVPDDSYTNDRIYVYVSRYIEDFDAATDDADYPQEWYMPLVWVLAMHVGPKYGVTGARLKEITERAIALKESALDFDVEDRAIHISPAFRK